MIPTTTTTMIDGDYDGGTLAMNDDDDDDDDFSLALHSMSSPSKVESTGRQHSPGEHAADRARAISCLDDCFWMPALIA